MINIVLFEPEIPQNTGNIMRTCVATNSTLHLIKPLGFKIDDAHLKRSGVNYIDKLEYEVYENYEDFKEKNPGIYYYFTRYEKSLIQVLITVIKIMKIYILLIINNSLSFTHKINGFVLSSY